MATSPPQQPLPSQNQSINILIPTTTLPATIQQQQSPLTILQQQHHQLPHQQQAAEYAESKLDMSSMDQSSSLTKKQFRMMKNRESACLSRKRKKEYMQSLEEKLKEIFLENQKLKIENNSLKEKVNSLSVENNNLKNGQKSFEIPSNANNNGRPLKRPLIMFAILFVVGLNVFHFADLNLGNSSNLVIGENQRLDFEMMPKKPDTSLSVHIGRTLLSDYDYEQTSSESNEDDGLHHRATGQDHNKRHEKISKRNHANNMDKLNLSLSNYNGSLELVKLNDTWHFIDPNICKKILYYNETHAIKINTELYNWYERLKNASGGSARTGASDASRPPQQQPQNGKIIDTKRYKMKNIIQKENLKQRQLNYELSLYNDDEKRYANFVNLIRERSDTFYVVSFRRDHIMFPALHHNSTHRPRMSFIMPAVVNHDHAKTSKDHSVSFMKIDCEILDTTMVNLKSTHIPTSYVKILVEDYDKMDKASTTTRTSSDDVPNSQSITPSNS